MPISFWTRFYFLNCFPQFMHTKSVFFEFLPAKPASDPTPPTKMVPPTALPTENPFL